MNALHNSGFTAHNIRLDDGTFTKPEAVPIADNQWCLAAKRLLQTLYPEGGAGRRIVDLGCLEGGYPVEFARMGMDAIGLEVRQNNFANCVYVKERISQPVKFVKMLAGLCRKALILNTHFAAARPSSIYAVGELTENEGVQGRWFTEYEAALDAKIVNELKWASWSNPRSFWTRREHIPDVLKEAGFQLVLEQFDFLDGRLSHEPLEGTYATHHRGMFVGVKCDSRR